MARYTINAYCDDNGNTVHADRSYALGQYADTTWTDRDEAEAVANELRADVGDVVDESVTYEVVETE